MIPSKLQLGAHTLSIQWIKDLHTSDGDLCYGSWEYTTRTISINTSFSPQDQASALLHEILHALSDFYGLELSEQTTHTLEMGLTEVVDRTPELLPLLIKAPPASPYAGPDKPS